MRKLQAKEISRLANSLAQLRFEAARKSTGTSSTALRPRLRKQYKARVSSALRRHAVDFFEKDGAISAGIVEEPDSTAFSGVKVLSVIPDFKLSSPHSRKWVERAIETRKHLFDDKTVMFLPAAYERLLPALLKSGFSIDSLILDGDPRGSLKALLRKQRPPTDLSHLGLQFRPATRNDIANILEISRKEFSRNPQYGWFCASPKFLRAQRKELTDAIRAGDHSHYVIERSGKFLGYFGSDATNRAKQAGISLIFDRKIQGKGIAKTAYLILLNDMVRKKVARYRGGTSQLPVMNIAKLMNRRLVLILLRYHAGYFPKEHFASFLD